MAKKKWKIVCVGVLCYFLNFQKVAKEKWKIVYVGVLCYFLNFQKVTKEKQERKEASQSLSSLDSPLTATRIPIITCAPRIFSKSFLR